MKLNYRKYNFNESRKRLRGAGPISNIFMNFWVEEVTRVSGTARVVASMRAGLSPQKACEEVVRHIARLRGDAIKGVQVGFLALDPRGAVGAFCLLPGFTYAVTDTAGRTIVHKAPSLFAA